MATPGRFAGRPVVPLDELDHTAHAHEVEGVDLGEGDVPFSVILVHGGPGTGRGCIATRIRRCSSSRPARRRSGSGPKRSSSAPDTWWWARRASPRVPQHRHRRIRLTAIHGSGRFDTEWLEGDDPVWTSPPREQAPTMRACISTPSPSSKTNAKPSGPTRPPRLDRRPARAPGRGRARVERPGPHGSRDGVGRSTRSPRPRSSR